MPPSQPASVGSRVNPWYSRHTHVPGDARLRCVATTRAERLAVLEGARLYFVCDGRPNGGDPTPLLRAAMRGGAEIVQLREKAPRCAEELISLAEPFRRVAAEHGGLFILNDRPDLVAECGADGAHVGQEDMPIGEARAAAGPGALIGLSTHTVVQVDSACSAQGPE